jgi:exopolysaccharide production protein ExoQ
MIARVVERLFAGFALFLTASALFPLLEGVGDSTLIQAPSDTRLTALSFAVYGIAGFLVLKRRTAVAEVMGRNKLLFSLVGLVVFSTAWSASPGTTAWKALALAMTTVLGVYLATSFETGELAALLAWVLAAIVLLSIVFAKLRPQYGLDHIRGDAWRGVFTTKNELGRIAVLAAVVWLVRAITLRGHLVTAVSLSLASLYTLLQSGSKTGLIVLLLLAVLVMVLPALRAHYSIAIPTAAVVAGAGVLTAQWLVGHSDAVLNSVGGNSNLTGRSEIWSAVWTMISAHPWLGYGFGAFWRGLDGPSAQVWAMVGETPPHAHNGVLDLWLDLGLAGVALMAGSFLVTTGRAVRALRGEWSLEAIFPTVVLAFLVFFNFSESTLLRPHSLFWVLYVATAVKLGLARAPEPVQELSLNRRTSSARHLGAAVQES